MAAASKQKAMVSGSTQEKLPTSSQRAVTIAFCFEAAAQGTVAQGAQLHFQHQAAEAWCYDCNQTVTLTERGQACPECGGYKLRVAQGDSLRITDIEVS